MLALLRPRRCGPAAGHGQRAAGGETGGTVFL